MSSPGKNITYENDKDSKNDWETYKYSSEGKQAYRRNKNSKD